MGVRHERPTTECSPSGGFPGAGVVALLGGDMTPAAGPCPIVCSAIVTGISVGRGGLQTAHYWTATPHWFRYRRM